MTMNIISCVLWIIACICSYMCGRSGAYLRWLRGVQTVLDKLEHSGKDDDFALAALWALKELAENVEVKRHGNKS